MTTAVVEKRCARCRAVDGAWVRRSKFTTRVAIYAHEGATATQFLTNAAKVSVGRDGCCSACSEETARVGG